MYIVLRKSELKHERIACDVIYEDYHEACAHAQHEEDKLTERNIEETVHVFQLIER